MEKRRSEKRIESLIGIEQLCPFSGHSHCGGWCAWFSDDACVIWDIAAILRNRGKGGDTK